MTKVCAHGLLILLLLGCSGQGDEKIKVLLVDGQNNHAAWPQTSPMITKILESSELFEVTLSRTPPTDGRRPDYGRAQPTVSDMPAELQAKWEQWRPDFSKYDVVVSNYNGVLWPDSVRKDFEEFVSQGGGLVVIHAADNAFAQWKEYNRMIGVGGWYGRNESDGPAIVWEDDKLVGEETKGKAGSHGKRGQVLVQNRAPDHPIMRGLPPRWMHPADEVYFNMRGPGENMKVLATALSDKSTGGSGRIQPILLALTYGKGRIYHDMLGHDQRAFAGVGFQNTLRRGTQWAATGQVTLPAISEDDLPADRLATEDPDDL